MGRPYAKELLALSDTLRWALELDVSELNSFVDDAGNSPLLAVGSGGSVAAAHYAALLHRQLVRRPSRHATPLEILFDEPGLGRSSVLMLSASGRNRDVLAAAQAAISAEVRAIGSVGTRSPNPLAELVRGYGRGHALAEQVPSGKDGYLATNSLLATLVLLARGYCVDLGRDLQTPEFGDQTAFASRSTAIVLHGGWSAPVATDLESRLHESTLMNAQVCDYRNFGHGRHLWLSQRPDETIVIALLTPETLAIADRTLGLVPADVPVLRLLAGAPGPAATIELLLGALHWTGAIAELRELDPGRPKVPQFGRRLFHVRPPKNGRNKAEPAIRRKLDRLNAYGRSSERIYQRALTTFCENLRSADIGAVALDYDGTLCTTRDRFDPLPDDMAAACSRLLEMGLALGIATGRGKSVREQLRGAFLSQHWDDVVIGYYNGADIAPLSDDSAPDKTRPVHDSIGLLSAIIDADPILHEFAVVEARPSQITVTPKEPGLRVDLASYLHELVEQSRSGVHFLRSGHSIDLVAPDVSKLRVVERLSARVAPRAVLCIGDRGAWPGNDSDLLSHELSLSVDQVSIALNSCWNFAPSGMSGPDTTRLYLNALRVVGGAVRFDLDEVKRGAQ